jgi:signal peptidase II
VTDRDTEIHSSACRSGCAYLIFVLTAGAGLTADLWTKQWACTTIGDPERGYLREPVVVIENYVQFYTRLNPGAIWSIASGQRLFLVVMSLAALIFLGWLFLALSSRQRWGQAALGLLTAGALGNMYDRIFNKGFVVDFIEVNLHFWPANPWPIFNIADVLLCTGVALLLISMARSHRRKAQSA